MLNTLLALSYMFTPKELSQILFLDIETAILAERYQDLSIRLQQAWEHEAQKI